MLDANMAGAGACARACVVRAVARPGIMDVAGTRRWTPEAPTRNPVRENATRACGPGAAEKVQASTSGSRMLVERGGARASERERAEQVRAEGSGRGGAYQHARRGRVA